MPNDEDQRESVRTRASRTDRWTLWSERDWLSTSQVKNTLLTMRRDLNTQQYAASPVKASDLAPLTQLQLLEGLHDTIHPHLLAARAVRAAVNHQRSALLLFGDGLHRRAIGLHGGTRTAYLLDSMQRFPYTVLEALRAALPNDWEMTLLLQACCSTMMLTYNCALWVLYFAIAMAASCKKGR